MVIVHVTAQYYPMVKAGDLSNSGIPPLLLNLSALSALFLA